MYKQQLTPIASNSVETNNSPVGNSTTTIREQHQAGNVDLVTHHSDKE